MLFGWFVRENRTQQTDRVSDRNITIPIPYRPNSLNQTLQYHSIEMRCLFLIEIIITLIVDLRAFQWDCHASSGLVSYCKSGPMSLLMRARFMGSFYHAISNSVVKLAFVILESLRKLLLFGEDLSVILRKFAR